MARRSKKQKTTPFNLKIISRVIKAKTRKLKTRWTLEAEQDLSAMFNFPEPTFKDLWEEWVRKHATIKE